nr:hypothetical protein [Tanacetum cinerariifolium]
KARDEGTQTYVLFPVLSDGSTNPKNSKDAHTGGNEHNDDIQKFVYPDIHSSSCGDQAREQVSAAELNFTHSTNDFSAAGPLNAVIPNLEDLSHNADDVGSGPAWLFDVDSLSQTMNYHPVLAGNQTNSNAAREQGDKAVNKDKGKNHVVTITGFRDLNEEFAECINNSSNRGSAAGPSVSAAGLDFTNSTNDFTAAGLLLSVAELNFTNSTNDFSVAGPSNAAMPNLEDLSHNADDVGAEADTNNMESIISEYGKRS